MSYFIWWECLPWVQLYACGMSYTADIWTDSHFPIPIPMFANTITTFLILITTFPCTNIHTSIHLLGVYYSLHSYVDVLKTCCAWIPTTLLLLRLHYCISGKHVLMSWLSCCQIIWLSLTYVSRYLEIRSSYFYCLNWWTWSNYTYGHWHWLFS